MQQQPLLVSSFIRHAARNHGAVEVVSRLGRRHASIAPTTPRLSSRSRRLVRVLQRLGVKHGDRVATLAWNGHRHLELYYAVSGMGAMCHTVNPRLALRRHRLHRQPRRGRAAVRRHQLRRAGGPSLAPLVRANVRAVVLLTDPADMPDVALAPGMRLACYETLMAEADDDYAWPSFDENTAAALCYTSGTTGRPKGVLYSHRSTVIHALGANQPDVFGLRATDRVLLCTPMFHVCGWGMPYVAPMVGAAQIYPGRHLDGASLHRLAETERATFSIRGAHRLARPVAASARDRRQAAPRCGACVSGGSAVPEALFKAYAEYGAEIVHGWGMTEMSPLGSVNRPNAATAGLATPKRRRSCNSKQGRGVFGDRAEDRRCRGERTAVGRRGVRRPVCARAVDLPRVLQARRRGRGGCQRLVRHR